MKNMSIYLSVEPIDSPDANAMLAELSARLEEITGCSGAASFDASDLLSTRTKFVVARDESGNALGCGAIRSLNEEVAELKRMYSRGSIPDVGSAVLNRLEQEAAACGYHSIRLETRKVNHKAVSFYLHHHYHIIPNYGKYVGKDEAICFEKILELPS